VNNITPNRRALEFRATGAECFGFLILRFFLVVVTFGVYLFWASSAWKRWVAEHTYVHDKPLIYHSSFADFVLFFIVRALLTFLSFFAYLPWAIVKGHRYDWRHTTVADGRNCRFDGSGLGYIGVKLLGLLLRVVTLNFGAAWAVAMTMRWEQEHLKIGGERVQFDGTGGQLFIRSLVGFILTLFTLGLYRPWHMVAMEKWKAEHSHVALGTDTSPVEADAFDAAIAKAATDRRTWYGLGALTAALVMFVLLGKGAAIIHNWFTDDPAIPANSPSAAAGEEEDNLGGDAEPMEGSELWSWHANHRIIVTPFVTSSIVYVGSTDGNAYAVRDGGSPAWKTNVGWVVGSPALAAGMVYIGTNRGVAALDATAGKVRWTRELRGGMCAPTTSAPTPSGSRVFVSTSCGSLYALDAETGKVAWTFSTGDLGSNVAGNLTPAMSRPVVDGGLVFVGSRSGKLFALDTATGKKRWEFRTSGGVVSTPAVGNGLVFVSAGGNESSLVSSPVFADGVVFVGSTSPTLHAVHASDGTPAWQAQLQQPLDRKVERDGAIHGDRNQNVVHAFAAATGAKQWAVSKGQVGTGTPAIDSRCVYVGNYDGTVWALDRTDGSQRWTFQTGGRAAGSFRMESHLIAPPAAANGNVYVSSTDQFLYVLKGCPAGIPPPPHAMAAAQSIPPAQIGTPLNSSGLPLDCSPTALERLEKPALRLKRNEIYARHGRVFQSDDLRQYFSSQPWYRPDPNFQDTSLSAEERACVARIKAMEVSRE
jgi:outer membrane protein assembly factor BamB/uncharacterized membrane protein YjgN (DUF898 family)